MPVLDAILDPNSISLYTNIAYDGNKLRLSPGNYDNSQLTMLGFTGANSIMIPFDFRVTIYTEDSFSGTPVILTSTAPDLSNTNISSIKIEYLNSYL
jgi:hypothetical protein